MKEKKKYHIRTTNDPRFELLGRLGGLSSVRAKGYMSNHDYQARVNREVLAQWAKLSSEAR
jgi:hypothetical protein